MNTRKDSVVDTKKATNLRRICEVCKTKKSPGPDGDSSDNWIKCFTCKKWHHKYCIGLHNTQFVKKYYYCMMCLQNSNFSIEFARLTQSITQTAPELIVSADKANDLSNLDTNTLETLCKDHMKIIWPYLKDQVQDVINKTISPLFTQNGHLLKRVEQLEDQIDEMQRKQRDKNIIIRGVPADFPIVDNSIVFKLASSINLKLQIHDVTSIQRLYTKNYYQLSSQHSKEKSNENSPLIMVSFINPIVKMNFMLYYFNALKRGVFIGSDLLRNNSDPSNNLISNNQSAKTQPSRIYVGEHLDKHTLNIFLKLRRLKNNKLIHSFNTKQGKAYVKVSESDKFRLIDSVDAIAKLEEQVSFNSINISSNSLNTLLNSHA